MNGQHEHTAPFLKFSSLKKMKRKSMSSGKKKDASEHEDCKDIVVEANHAGFQTNHKEYKKCREPQPFLN